MFTITAIGSCRISNPLRLCRDEYGFSINDKRIYGYSHSSAEAVQQMRALDSSFQPNEALWPLMSLRNDLSKFQGQEHRKSHLYIVELASAKIITIGDTYVQHNYMSQHFKEFFEDKERAIAYWNLCRLGDQDGIDNFLAQNWSNSAEQQEDCLILRFVRVLISDEQSLFDDIQLLKDGLENILVVSHVNARNSEGNHLASRNKFIDQVTQASNKAGVPFYNPTELMEQMGQIESIEDYSTGLAHFTDNFSRKIYDEWNELMISSLMEEQILENPERNIQYLLVPHAHKILETGQAKRVEDLEFLVDSIEGYYPRNLDLKQLQLDIASFSNDPNRIKRAVFQLVFSCDLSNYNEPCFPLQYNPDAKEWIAEIIETPSLPETSFQWLTQTIDSLDDSDLLTKFQNIVASKLTCSPETPPF